jgi:hypothetical protein
MKKLNGFESWLITEGLNILRNEWKNEIKLAETNNKIPIMTEAYADMVVDETIEKIKLLTLKQK